MDPLPIFSIVCVYPSPLLLSSGFLVFSGCFFPLITGKAEDAYLNSFNICIGVDHFDITLG